MYVYHESAGTYVCKKCKNKIAIADVDEIYLDQLKGFLLTNTDIDSYREQSDSILKEKEQLLDRTKAEFQKLGKVTIFSTLTSTRLKR